MPPSDFGAIAPPPALRAERSDGYLGSSLDLRSGLEVRLVAEHQLTAEMRLEFARLRALWGQPPQPPQPPQPAPSARPAQPAR